MGQTSHAPTELPTLSAKTKIISSVAESTPEDQSLSRRVQRTINFDREVLERARAAATHLAAYEPVSNVHSLADIVNSAGEAYVSALEQRYNNGNAFRPVAKMLPGRPAQNY